MSYLQVSKVLPHSHYFYSGVIGSGMCTFSRSPIKEVLYHPFALNGYPHKILHGDWWGSKGLAVCRTTRHGIPFTLINLHVSYYLVYPCVILLKCEFLLFIYLFCNFLSIRNFKRVSSILHILLD